MSALGQKQTSKLVQSMSALPPKADMIQQGRDVRFVPKADIGALRFTLSLEGKEPSLAGVPGRRLRPVMDCAQRPSC